MSDLAAKNDDGSYKGFWGAMTNFAFAFKPWENNFSEGMYLAGVETEPSAAAPAGWKKWIVPGFEYVKVLVENENTFSETLQYLKEHHMMLAGAVQDYTDPAAGRAFMVLKAMVQMQARHLL